MLRESESYDTDTCYLMFFFDLWVSGAYAGLLIS